MPAHRTVPDPTPDPHDPVARLSPADAVVALRSFPRRHRAAILPVDDDGPLRAQAEAEAEQVAADGWSALERAEDSVRVLVALGRVLADISTRDRPVVLADLLDPRRRHWESSAGLGGVDDVLAQLAEAAAALADQVAGTPTDAWARVGVRSGDGEEVTALDVVREAVRTVAANLRAIERGLAAIRTTR